MSMDVRGVATGGLFSAYRSIQHVKMSAIRTTVMNLSADCATDAVVILVRMIIFLYILVCPPVREKGV